MNKPSVSIIIPTFGDYEQWNRTALVAEQSAHHQSHGPYRVIRTHDTTLAKARNMGAVQARTDWLIFLDADDLLDRHYCESMLQALDESGPGKWIFRPSTLGIVNGVEDDGPVMIPRQNLFDANCIVIGAMVNRDRFLRAGGFTEFPILEDWALFLALYVDGAEIVDVPAAVYKVNVSPDGRNSQGASLHGEVYSEIRRMYAADRHVRPDQE